jgi:hypothetical protein
MKLAQMFRQLTAHQRALPDFLIIGAQKCGTTTLYRALQQHPRLVSNVTEKEVHYFDDNYGRGPSWYRSHFPIQAEDNSLYFEATPYYLFHPLAPQRVAQDLPHVKLIAILRNPTERAFSHYQHQVRNGREPLTTFAEALAAESERLRGEAEALLQEGHYQSFAHRKFSYQARGFYLQQLQRWLEFFPREQLHVLLMEEFQQDPQQALQSIFHFLGVDNFVVPNLAPRNQGKYQTHLNEQDRQQLNELYHPPNQELAAWLGRELNWE